MRERHDPRWAYVFVKLATLFWAGNMTLGRALHEQVGPFTLAAARVGIASVLFLLMLPRLPSNERRPGREWPWLLAMAVTGVAGFPVLLYFSLRYTTASNAALINGAAPLVTALLAAVLIRARLSPHELLGALLSLAGVLLIITGSEGIASSGLQLNTDDLVMVANVALWGLYSIISRQVTRARSTVWATTFSALFALPLLLPIAVLEWRQAPPVVDGRLIAAMSYIGVFAAFLAFLAWNEGVRRVGPSGAMAFYNMLPVFGALLGALFLGETLQPGQAVGGLLVVAGGLLAALRRPLLRASPS